MKSFVGFFKLALLLSVVAVVSGYLVMRIGLWGAHSVSIPSLVGQDIVSAVESTSRLGLNLRIGHHDFDPEIPKNHVIRQNPPADYPLRKNRIVQVVLSKGSKQVEIPHLVEASLRRSQSIIRKMGLSISKTYPVYSDEFPEKSVIAQSPAAGTQVDRGSKMELLVSKGPYPDFLMIPDFSSISLDQAITTIKNLKLRIKKINYRRSQGVSRGIVLSQKPIFGSKIEKGSFIELTVSEGAVTESEKTKTFTLLHFKVPPVSKPAKVIIRVDNEEGEKEVYNRLQRSGDEISLLVELSGRTTAKIYVDDELKEVKHFPN